MKLAPFLILRKALLRSATVLMGMVIGLGTAWSNSSAPTPTKPVLRIAFGDASPPNYWASADGKPVQGLMVDIMRAVAARAGFEMDAQAYPLARVQRMVETGAADGMCNVVTPARREYALPIAEPLLVGKVALFARKDSPALNRIRAIKSLDDLPAANIVVLAMVGSGWTKQNVEDRGVTVSYGSGTTGAVRMLMGKRGDAVIDMSTNIRWILREVDPGAEIVELPIALQMVGWHLQISKLSPFAQQLPTLNKALSDFKASAEYKTILKRYGAQI